MDSAIEFVNNRMRPYKPPARMAWSLGGIPTLDDELTVKYLLTLTQTQTTRTSQSVSDGSGALVECH
jgi:hypothetical protein